MKKAAPFITGFIAGVLGTLLVLYLMYNSDNQTYDSSYDGLLGLTIFPEKGECIPTENEIEVIQVVKPNKALAYTHEYYDDRITVLLINYDGESYYDQQKIKVPSGQCARQIGTFQYTDRLRSEHTVPAVVIE